MDTFFSFQGLVGKITCIPTDKVPCVNMAEDKYDEDDVYYLVSFNDNRTNYAFRSTDLELHQPRHNYQLWWVQRTRYNFIIQKKKVHNSSRSHLELSQSRTVGHPRHGTDVHLRFHQRPLLPALTRRLSFTFLPSRQTGLTGTP